MPAVMMVVVPGVRGAVMVAVAVVVTAVPVSVARVRA